MDEEAQCASHGEAPSGRLAMANNGDDDDGEGALGGKKAAVEKRCVRLEQINAAGGAEMPPFGVFVRKMAPRCCVVLARARALVCLRCAESPPPPGIASAIVACFAHSIAQLKPKQPCLLTQPHRNKHTELGGRYAALGRRLLSYGGYAKPEVQVHRPGGFTGALLRAGGLRAPLLVKGDASGLIPTLGVCLPEDADPEALAIEAGGGDDDDERPVRGFVVIVVVSGPRPVGGGDEGRGLCAGDLFFRLVCMRLQVDA
jgi:hypothetical protein